MDTKPNTVISPPSKSPSPVAHSSSPNCPQSSAAIVTPCAACRILRRRCVEKCVLAPYFPPTMPHKFATAHRVFGASNIIKILQEVPEYQRDDAVASMVYEANARIRDPVYGCAGAICRLQNQIGELQAQLAKTQADLVNLQTHQGNLLSILCHNINVDEDYSPPVEDNLRDSNDCTSTSFFSDLEADLDSGGAWKTPLWT